MTPAEFVASVRTSVIEENLDLYRDIFDAGVATDPYWVRAIELSSALTGEQKETLLAIMRQVSVDACSTIFGAFDGTTSLGASMGGFELRHEGELLNGDLQDLLLSAEEDAV